METKQKTKRTRMGVHKDGKVSIGIYADENFRALLTLLVDITGETATDILMDGVNRRAMKEGIMSNGKVVDKYKNAIEIIKMSYRMKAKSRKEKKGEK